MGIITPDPNRIDHALLNRFPKRPTARLSRADAGSKRACSPATEIGGYERSDEWRWSEQTQRWYIAQSDLSAGYLLTSSLQPAIDA
jgi:hypothetical protein